MRILGMTDTGAALIKESHGKSELEFVTKTADFAPAAESFHGGVYIYAAEMPEAMVTIPTIVLWR